MTAEAITGAARPRTLRRVASWLAAAFLADRDRWALWLPVAGGLGVAGYFGLAVEPPLWLGAAAAAAAVACAVALRRWPWASAILLLLVAAGLGFAAAQIRTVLVAAPVLQRELSPVELSGRVVEVQALPDGRRLLLDQLAIERLAPEATPLRLRIRVPNNETAIAPGDRVTLLAGIAPPSAPFAPGAFDFQRHAFFQRIGGYGFSYGAPRGVEPSADRDTGLDVALWFAELRQGVTDRVLAVLPGGTGAVAAALMAGTQSAIPEDVMVTMRDSGLAHLLSISGLHVGLVAGILFVGLRAVLALLPALALRHPIKKWAAAAAIAAALFYTLLAGAPVPTMRAFLMTGLVLLAVLLDRSPFSMRAVAWAAAVILLFAPETLTGPSFQMSFAAVVALIAAYEASRDWRRQRRGEAGWPQWILRYAAGLAFTSLIAGLATAPYAVFHFGRMADYGIVANMLAVPITGIWIMPWAVIAYFLMPFGLDALALVPMGWGVDAVIWVARVVAGWPGAAVTISAMPLWGLALATVGGLWLCLWQLPWRLLGAVPLVAGFCSIALTTPPDLLISGDAKLMGVRDAAGGLLVSTTRAEAFTTEGWLRRLGDEAAEPFPAAGGTADGWLACDPLGCIYRAAGHVVALVKQPGALREDCGVADVVVSAVPVRHRCPSARVVVDRFDLWREGAHALWLSPGTVEVVSVGDTRGERPWVVRPTAGEKN